MRTSLMPAPDITVYGCNECYRFYAESAEGRAWFRGVMDCTWLAIFDHERADEVVGYMIAAGLKVANTEAGVH